MLDVKKDNHYKYLRFNAKLKEGGSGNQFYNCCTVKVRISGPYSMNW
jgi:hypothetical protein